MSDYNNQLIKHLEILIEHGNLNNSIYIFKKGDQLKGFELATKEEPITIDSTETAELRNVLEFYLEIKGMLGINKLSATIKAYRLNKGLTQMELAEKIGKTKQEINRWESGVKPSQEIFDIIMLHLNWELSSSLFYCIV